MNLAIMIFLSILEQSGGGGGARPATLHEIAVGHCISPSGNCDGKQKMHID